MTEPGGNVGAKFNLAATVLSASAIGAAALFGTGAGQSAFAQGTKPNILFIILDDLGIDQLKIFNPDVPLPPLTPNIDLIAKRGVKFTNAWAMPECSPSRAAFFTGRYAIRTGVEAALLDNHLPQSYVSSFETTLPRILTKAGYTNALIGKYHLGNLDPGGSCAPAARGFQTFQGVIRGGPPPVDTTAGGVDKSASQVCGYYQTKAAGACYTAPGDSVRCSPINAGNADPGTDPARSCLQRGGIFVPNKACGVGGPKYSDFSNLNAYYVWNRTSMSGVLDPLYVNSSNSCQPNVDRRFLTAAQGIDSENWWKRQSGPRMLTLSFNSMHTPVQKPSTDLVPDPQDAASTCNNSTPPQALLNMMIESMDVQVGRTLANIGLGKLAADGRTLVSLNLGNTMVVVLGDNGSLAQTVRLPFNPARAKASVYQTGVWIPMIIAGPVVKAPGRSVDEMINAVDLYQLFGDIAGIDVKSIVPPSHALDSQPMLPYLTDPAAPAIRQTNFTQQGIGNYSPVPSERSYPCQIPSANFCDETRFNSKSLCVNDGGGTWYGPGGKKQLTSCCAVQSYLGTPQTFAPVHQYALRNGVYKLVQLQRVDCSKPITSPSQPKPFPWAEYLTTTTQEFYDLTPTVLNPKGLDNANGNLAKNCAPGENLATCLPTPVAKTNYKVLNKELQAKFNSTKAQNNCQAAGDGNLDMRVTQADIQGWQAFNGEGPSRYDINLDGQTDEDDLKIIQANLGLNCLNACIRADLNRDKKVDSKDMALLSKQTGTCTDPIFCGGDLNGDGKVNNSDVRMMKAAQTTCK
jgi:hypothetical protein